MKKTKVEDLKRIEISQFKKKKKREVIIILDNLRSLNNVGSCFRTSDAFLIKKIYLVGITGSPPNTDIDRTALGATESVDWEYVSCISNIEKQLKDRGWKIALIEQTDKSIDLKDFHPTSDEKFAFVSLDLDLYKPTFEGLRFFYPKMIKGGCVLIHDYFTPSYP